MGGNLANSHGMEISNVLCDYYKLSEVPGKTDPARLGLVPPAFQSIYSLPRLPLRSMFTLTTAASAEVRDVVYCGCFAENCVELLNLQNHNHEDENSTSRTAIITATS